MWTFGEDKMRFPLIAAVAALVLGATQAQALSADFANDFSVTNSNPNGAWTYGYTTSLGGTFNAYTDTISNPVVDIWYTPGLSGDSTPSAFKNTSGGSVNGILPGEAGLHSGPGGQLSVARLTSTEVTDVTISGAFGQGDIGGVGVYILLDGVEIFGVSNTYQTEMFDLTASLGVGSTLDFVVSNGDGSYAYDSTQLSASVESVPEPASMVALSVGAIALVRRRRAK
jgi:hypothetical protein